MGLVTLPGTQIQYFSLSEEIQAVSVKFFAFIFNLAPGWILLITGLSIAFIVAGVFYRLANEIDEAG